MKDTNKQAHDSRQKPKSKTRAFFIRMPDEIREALKVIAERDERSVSQIIRFALRDYVTVHDPAPEPAAEVTS